MFGLSYLFPQMTICVVFALLVDRVFKIFSTAYASHFREVFGFTATVNDGVGISLGAGLGGWVNGVVLGIWLVCTYYVVVARRNHIFGWWLILLGAGSNLFDRFVYGGVIDYIPLGNISMFNIADVMIVAGVGGLIWSARKLPFNDKLQMTNQ